MGNNLDLGLRWVGDVVEFRFNVQPRSRSTSGPRDGCAPSLLCSGAPGVLI